MKLHRNEDLSIPKEIGRCPNCGVFGTFEVLTDEVAAGHTEKSSIRAGPAPPPDSKNIPKSEATQEARGVVPSAFTFEAFWQMFVAAGKALSFADKQRAYREWRRVEAYAERIHAWIADQFAGPWRSPDFTPMPHSALVSEGWTRVAVARTLPSRVERETPEERRKAAVKMAEEQWTEMEKIKWLMNNKRR